MQSAQSRFQGSAAQRGNRLLSHVRSLTLLLASLPFMAAATQTRGQTIPPVEVAPPPKAVVPPVMPRLDFTDYETRITEKQKQASELQKPANDNKAAYERTRQAALDAQARFIDTGKQEEKEWVELNTKQAQAYKAKADRLQGQIDTLNKEIAALRDEKEKGMKASQDQIMKDWEPMQDYLMARRIHPQDMRLTNKYPAPPKGFMIASSVNQGNFSVYYDNAGSKFNDEVISHTNKTGSVQAAFAAAVKSYRHCTVVTGDNLICPEHPLVSLTTTETFSVAENDAMGKHRYVFFFIGDRNPGENTYNFDEESFERGMLKLKHAWAKRYNIPMDAAHFIVVRQPDSDQAVRDVFKQMADICERTRIETKGAIKPEIGTVLLAHGNLNGRDDGSSPRRNSVEGLEPGLPKEEMDMEGAQVGYVVMKSAKGGAPGYTLTETQIKQYMAEFKLGEVMRGGFLFTLGCQGGSMIASRSDRHEAHIGKV